MATKEKKQGKKRAKLNVRASFVPTASAVG